MTIQFCLQADQECFQAKVQLGGAVEGDEITREAAQKREILGWQAVQPEAEQGLGLLRVATGLLQLVQQAPEETSEVAAVDVAAKRRGWERFAMAGD